MVKSAFEYAGNFLTVLRQSALWWDSPRAKIHARLRKFCRTGGPRRPRRVL